MPARAGYDVVIAGASVVPNKMRRAAHAGVAFVGDAALATDPLFGVGCGWAFKSAEWLVDETRSALLRDGDLVVALDRYRRAFRRRLGPHHVQIADYSTGRPMRLNERIALRAGASDPVVGAAIERFAPRRSGILPLLDPRLNSRVVRAGLRSTEDGRRRARGKRQVSSPDSPAASSAFSRLE